MNFSANGGVTDRARPRMVGRVREVPLPHREIPDWGDFLECITADGRRVFVAKRVLAELEELEARHAPSETAGLLFGRAFSDGAKPCSLVTELVAPHAGEVMGTGSTVTITAHGAERMKRRAYRNAPCADPIGWAHTHPRFTPYFSAVDRAEQQAWKEPTSVGIVMSGLEDCDPRFAVFVGPEATPAEILGPERATAIEPVVRERARDRQPERTPSRPLALTPPQVRERARRRRLGVRARRALIPVAIVLVVGQLLALMVLGLQTATEARSRAERAEQAVRSATGAAGVANDRAGDAAERAESAQRDAREAKRLAERHQQAQPAWDSQPDQDAGEAQEGSPGEP